MTRSSLDTFSKVLHRVCRLPTLEKRGEAAEKSASLMLVLTLAITLCSMFNVSNAAVYQFDMWVRWAPSPDQVGLRYWQLCSISCVNVSFSTETWGYNVSSWGVPAVDGSRITVDAEAWQYLGPVIEIPMDFEHTYFLGFLPAGGYVFEFRVWNDTVKEITFEAGWVPWVPARDQVELHYWQQGSTSYVNVSVYIESVAYNVSSWGAPVVDGRNIAADAEAWYWTGPIILIYDPRTYYHTYDLGSLPAGDYVFDFLVWGSPVKEITFSVMRTLPRLEVEPYYSYVHDGFATVNITIQGIEASDHAVAIGFLLTHDPVLELSDITEGPFLQDPRWNLHGTVFIIEFLPLFEGNIRIGDLLMPDENDNWTVFPEGNGVLATVEFQAVSNIPSQEHIWTWVSLSDAYGVSSLSSDATESIGISSIGGWVCLLEEAAADVVMDGKVDMWDLATVAKRFGSTLGDDRWSPRADVNGDNRIDMEDLGFVANQWGNNFEVPQWVPWVPEDPWPPIEPF